MTRKSQESNESEEEDVEVGNQNTMYVGFKL